MSDYSRYKCRECGKWLYASNPQSNRDTCCMMCPEGHGKIIHGISPLDMRRAKAAAEEEELLEKSYDWRHSFAAAERQLGRGFEIHGVVGLFAKVRKIKPLDKPDLPDRSRLARIGNEVWEFRPIDRRQKIKG